MDISISKQTLSMLEEVMDDVVLKCLQEVHQKFLSDLDFSEFESIRKKVEKKKNLFLKKVTQKKQNHLKMSFVIESTLLSNMDTLLRYQNNLLIRKIAEEKKWPLAELKKFLPKKQKNKVRPGN